MFLKKSVVNVAARANEFVALIQRNPRPARPLVYGRSIGDKDRGRDRKGSDKLHPGSL